MEYLILSDWAVGLQWCEKTIDNHSNIQYNRYKNLLSEIKV